jgi:hypothetical protein
MPLSSALAITLAAEQRAAPGWVHVEATRGLDATLAAMLTPPSVG